MTPEFEVLLSCLRGDPAEVLEERLHAVGPDHTELLRLAARHWVQSLLCVELRGKGLLDRLDVETRGRLQATQLYMAARQTRMVSIALKVIDALEASGIRSLPLKGTAMIATAWPEYLPRDMGDLDIMVEPLAVDRAGAVLKDLGFALDLESFRFCPWSPHPVKAESQQVALDLHVAPWGTMPLEPRAPDPDLMWGTTVQGMLLGRPVAVFSPEYNALTLLAGMGRDRFFTLLRHWMDFAWLLSRPGHAADPTSLQQTADAVGAGGSLRLAFGFAEELLGTVASSMASSATAGGVGARARKTLWRRLLAAHEGEVVPRSVLRVLAGGGTVLGDLVAAGRAGALERRGLLSRMSAATAVFSMVGGGMAWGGRLAVSSAARRALREETALLRAVRG